MIVSQCTDMRAVSRWFARELDVIESKVPPTDPSREQTLAAIAAARKAIPPEYLRRTPAEWAQLVLLIAAAAGAGYLLWQRVRRGRK